MKPHKQTVYLPVKIEYELPKPSKYIVLKENGDKDFVYTPFSKDVTHWLKLQEGYFFTPEQLNEYTQNVIKQSLETAAENAQTIDTYKTRWSGLNKEGFVEKDVYRESITNTFQKIFKQFEV